VYNDHCNVIFYTDLDNTDKIWDDAFKKLNNDNYEETEFVNAEQSELTSMIVC